MTAMRAFNCYGRSSRPSNLTWQWLQLHVESVFGMKNMAGRVERMREDVNILENEVKSWRAILAAAEANLERAKGDLVKAEQEFKMGDLDSIIGYPLA
ncbi:hypothetical protein M0R45_036243 [Rubus argutus]|uniref:Uncharacterized protein n=1 Tax=Rubus argutus TaxID=59490 RepID=A0AAW1VWG5_RUBAR